MDLLDQMNRYIAGIGVDHAICGGSAIDLFVGHKTRPHKDLDVAVYWDDRDAIVRYMLDQGWDVYEPCGGEVLHKTCDVRGQRRVKSNIWCVRPGNPHYRFVEQGQGMYTVHFDDSEQSELDFIELLFNHRKDGFFLYARDQEIKLALNRAVLWHGDIPCLAPELVLLYKSTAVSNPDYQVDFDNAAPKMDQEQMAWLEQSLTHMYPDGHRWLEQANLHTGNLA